MLCLLKPILFKYQCHFQLVHLIFASKAPGNETWQYENYSAVVEIVLRKIQIMF
jgi:hypothetical protein